MRLGTRYGVGLGCGWLWLAVVGCGRGLTKLWLCLFLVVFLTQNYASNANIKLAAAGITSAGKDVVRLCDGCDGCVMVVMVVMVVCVCVCVCRSCRSFRDHPVCICGRTDTQGLSASIGLHVTEMGGGSSHETLPGTLCLTVACTGPSLLWCVLVQQRVVRRGVGVVDSLIGYVGWLVGWLCLELLQFGILCHKLGFLHCDD